MKKTLLPVLTLSLILPASRALAQSALSQLATEAGVDAAPLVSRVRAFQTGARSRRLQVPRQAKDVLAQCPAIDAQTIRAWTLPEAVGQVQSCLDRSYAPRPNERRSYSVTASAARLTVRVCPEPKPGMLACQAFMEVDGIAIAVQGALAVGNPVLADLGFSLDKRGGKLLGFPAQLDNKASLLK